MIGPARRTRGPRAAVAVVLLYLLLPAGAFDAPAPAVAGTPAAAAAADTTASPAAPARRDSLPRLAPIVVTGDRLEATLPGALRPVAVRAEQGLARLPAWSAAEPLAQAPGVEVRQRQLFGAQGDLSIRGSTFEQVQMLFDGVDVADPQTGHHLLDLPLGAGDVARLEVLRGHGSVLFGGQAFGGTVNVVPRAPGAVTAGELGLTGGGDGTWRARAALDAPWGELRTRLSAERFRTDGDRPGTDARNWSVTSRSCLPSDRGEGELFLGFVQRSFGALDFYAPYPSWERTRTFLGVVRWRGDISDRAAADVRFHMRRHADRFVLVRTDPDAFTNDHSTEAVGTNLRVAADVPSGLLLAGALDAGYDYLRSAATRRIDGEVLTGEALGWHKRHRVACSLELSETRRPLRWSLGSRLEAATRWRARLLGTAAASWSVTEGAVLRASAGSVWRVPTFTELYYWDPVNRGDSGLAPEHGWSWDVGADLRRGGFALGATWFARYERDLIDWVRATGSDGPWTAANIGRGRTCGTETELTWTAPRGHLLAVCHAWYDRARDLPVDVTAKYGPLVPRHLLAAEATAVLPADLALTLAARWRDGATLGNGPLLVDARLLWTLPGWTLTVLVTNLADRAYAEIPGVPLPGRLVAATMTRRF